MAYFSLISQDLNSHMMIIVDHIKALTLYMAAKNLGIKEKLSMDLSTFGDEAKDNHISKEDMGKSSYNDGKSIQPI